MSVHIKAQLQSEKCFCGEAEVARNRLLSDGDVHSVWNGLEESRFIVIFSAIWASSLWLGQAEFFPALESSLITKVLQLKLCLPKHVSKPPH